MYDFKEHNLENIRDSIQHHFEVKDKKIKKLISKTNKDKKDKKGKKEKGKKKH